jgi:hypothetical protein
MVPVGERQSVGERENDEETGGGDRRQLRPQWEGRPDRSPARWGLQQPLGPAPRRHGRGGARERAAQRLTARRERTVRRTRRGSARSGQGGVTQRLLPLRLQQDCLSRSLGAGRVKVESGGIVRLAHAAVPEL